MISEPFSLNMTYIFQSYFIFFSPKDNYPARDAPIGREALEVSQPNDTRPYQNNNYYYQDQQPSLKSYCAPHDQNSFNGRPPMFDSSPQYKQNQYVQNQYLPNQYSQNQYPQNQGFYNSNLSNQTKDHQDDPVPYIRQNPPNSGVNRQPYNTLPQNWMSTPNGYNDRFPVYDSHNGYDGLNGSRNYDNSNNPSYNQPNMYHRDAYGPSEGRPVNHMPQYTTPTGYNNIEDRRQYVNTNGVYPNHYPPSYRHTAPNYQQGDSCDRQHLDYNIVPHPTTYSSNQNSSCVPIYIQNNIPDKPNSDHTDVRYIQEASNCEQNSVPSEPIGQLQESPIIDAKPKYVDKTFMNCSSESVNQNKPVDMPTPTVHLQPSKIIKPDWPFVRNRGIKHSNESLNRVGLSLPPNLETLQQSTECLNTQQHSLLRSQGPVQHSAETINTDINPFVSINSPVKHSTEMLNQNPPLTLQAYQSDHIKYSNESINESAAFRNHGPIQHSNEALNHVPPQLNNGPVRRSSELLNMNSIPSNQTSVPYGKVNLSYNEQPALQPPSNFEDPRTLPVSTNHHELSNEVVALPTTLHDKTPLRRSTSITKYDDIPISSNRSIDTASIPYDERPITPAKSDSSSFLYSSETPEDLQTPPPIKPKPAIPKKPLARKKLILCHDDTPVGPSKNKVIEAEDSETGGFDPSNPFSCGLGDPSSPAFAGLFGKIDIHAKSDEPKSPTRRRRIINKPILARQASKEKDLNRKFKD